MYQKTFNTIKNYILPFVGVWAIFDWIVFPGLTTSDTYINILSGFVGLITLVVAFSVFGLEQLFTREFWNNKH